MSERAAMKHRVRGLLRRNWLAPLAALLLACIPVVLLSALLIFFMRPMAQSHSAIETMQFSLSFDDPEMLKSLLIQIFAMLIDPWTLLEPLLGWLPLSLSLLCLMVLVVMPLGVSLSDYFLAFLRGKNPRIVTVFGCFSGRYPRILGGMLYKTLWVFIWLTVSFIAPTLLLLSSALIASALGSSIGPSINIQVYLFAALAIFCVLWFVVAFFIFVNRMLAYILTPVCIAAQPRLAAHRAIRLSRKLMRGNKWQLIGLYLSFLLYFIPSILAGIALILLPFLPFGMAAQPTIRIALWIIIGINQLVWLYVAPYMAACFHAFYIERKREALMDEEISEDDLASASRGKNNEPVEE